MASTKVKIKTIKELELMPIKQLISRLRKLLSCENSFERSDLAYDASKNPEELFPYLINYKETEKWKKAYNDVKQILSNLEHIPKGKELSKIKSDKLKMNKTKDKITIK